MLIPLRSIRTSQAGRSVSYKREGNSQGNLGSDSRNNPQEEVMTAVLTDMSAVATLAASESNLCAAWSDIGCALPGELYNGSDMFRILSGLPSPFWNAVYRPRFSPETVDEQS